MEPSEDHENHKEQINNTPDKQQQTQQVLTTCTRTNESRASIDEEETDALTDEIRATEGTPMKEDGTKISIISSESNLSALDDDTVTQIANDAREAAIQAIFQSPTSKKDTETKLDVSQQQQQQQQQQDTQEADKPRSFKVKKAKSSQNRKRKRRREALKTDHAAVLHGHSGDHHLVPPGRLSRQRRQHAAFWSQPGAFAVAQTRQPVRRRSPCEVGSSVNSGMTQLTLSIKSHHTIEAKSVSSFTMASMRYDDDSSQLIAPESKFYHGPPLIMATLVPEEEGSQSTIVTSNHELPQFEHTDGASKPIAVPTEAVSCEETHTLQTSTDLPTNSKEEKRRKRKQFLTALFKHISAFKSCERPPFSRSIGSNSPSRLLKRKRSHYYSETP